MSRRPVVPVLLDRAAGALLGTAVGDALGAGYEFGTAPLAPGAAEMIGGGLGNFAPGEFTDDTAMALCIAEAGLAGHDLTTRTGLDAVGERFLAWARSGPPDIGISTAAVLRGPATGADLPDRARAHLAATGRGGGNGALMRTATVALVHLGHPPDVAVAARGVAELTHADPLAGDAAVLWSLAIEGAVRTGELLGPVVGLDLLPPERRADWAGWIAEAEAGPPGRFTPNGYTVTAHQAAWSAICSVADDGPAQVEAALQAAIAIGNDTDTIAAIAGALVAARWGATAIPLRRQVLVHGPVPDRSGPVVRGPDLRAMAVHLMANGTDDEAGWPGSPDLSEHYRRAWPAAPRAVALADDPGLLIGNVHGLASADADAFASLCRIGPAQRRALDHAEVQLIDASDLALNPNLDHVLADTAGLVARWRAEGRRVFLHCVMGQSRTPAVAALVLAHQLGISASDALARIRTQVPDADPNPALLQALARLAP